MLLTKIILAYYFRTRILSSDPLSLSNNFQQNILRMKPIEVDLLPK